MLQFAKKYFSRFLLLPPPLCLFVLLKLAISLQMLHFTSYRTSVQSKPIVAEARRFAGFSDDFGWIWLTGFSRWRKSSDSFCDGIFPNCAIAMYRTPPSRSRSLRTPAIVDDRGISEYSKTDLPPFFLHRII